MSAADLPKTPDETLTTGSTAGERPPATDWMTRAEKSADQGGTTETVPATHREFVDAVIGLVEFGFVIAARRTGWDGWKIDPVDEEPHLQRALGFLLRNVKPEKYLDVVSIGYLGIILAGKGMGYMEWRKSHGGREGTGKEPSTGPPPGATGGAPKLDFSGGGAG